MLKALATLGADDAELNVRIEKALSESNAELARMMAPLERVE